MVRAAVLLAALWFAGAAYAQPTVYLSSQSRAVTQGRLADALPAFQWAVTRDFAPYWDADATLTATAPATGDWPVTVTDSPAPCDLWGCVLGYHAVTGYGVPYAVVYTAAAAIAGVSWQIVLSHELFEMLADPYGDRAELAGQTFSIIEVCDPVAGWEWQLPSATGRPVKIADYVTPAWFRRHARGPFDLQRRLSSPFQLGGGGYRNVWNPDTNTWATIF